MTGAKLVVKCLVEQGVRDIFGYPGASVLALFDAIAAEKRLNLVVNTHEEFCAFAADGYARSSGRVGVCIATSGPGATNLVTGIANANADSIPLVAITGNVPLGLLGTDAFQEVDIAGVTMPITKHNFIVKSVASLVPTLREAFRIANEGRKGPVLVDIPSDLFASEAPYPKKAPAAVPPAPGTAGLAPVAELINSSRSPLICVGGGVRSSGAFDEIASLVSRLDCPVVSTAMGIGSFDQSDVRYRGLVGMNISGDASVLLDSSDLLIAVGVRFSDRMLVSLRDRNGLKLLHIDVDDAEIDKNLQPLGSLVGDAKQVLTDLLPLIKKRKATARPPVGKQSSDIFALLAELLPDAVFSTEVGLHQVEACKRLPVTRPRSFLTSGGLGAMGYGLPAAIGASFANPGRRVVNIAGDGSFNMNMQELATAKLYSVPLIQIVMNNRSLGMIEKMQSDRSLPRCCVETPFIDYRALASAFGASYFFASDFASFKTAVEKAALCGGVALIEYRYTGVDPI